MSVFYHCWSMDASKRPLPDLSKTLKICPHFTLFTTGLGRVFIAPIDVVLAPKVVVQADVIVLLNANRDKITESSILGAPDLVVEVASPGTAIYDRNDKYDIYARAEISEYWIADPGTHTVEILVLEGGTYHSLVAFLAQAILPSRAIPGMTVYVEQFFT